MNLGNLLDGFEIYVIGKVPGAIRWGIGGHMTCLS